MRSVANATCTAWRHHKSPEHTPEGHATILLESALEGIISCTKIDQNSGQCFNQCAMNATAVWLLQTRFSLFVSTATRERFSQAAGNRAMTYFLFPGTNRLGELVRELTSTIDETPTFGRHKDQNFSITKTTGAL